MTKDEELIIDAIVKRAMPDMRVHWFDGLLKEYIIIANKIKKLKLKNLLESNDNDFFHDIYGFLENLDIEKEIFKNNFIPKFQGILQFDYDNTDSWQFLRFETTNKIGKIIGYDLLMGEKTKKEYDKLKDRPLYRKSEVWWKNQGIRFKVVIMNNVEDLDKSYIFSDESWHILKVFPLSYNEAKKRLSLKN